MEYRPWRNDAFPPRSQEKHHHRNRGYVGRGLQGCDALARTLIKGGTFGATRQSRRQPYQFAHFGMQAGITLTATFGRAGRKVALLSEL
jgi:hypothetical protein